MKRLIQITLTICATLLGFALIWVFQPVLALFGGSLALSAALRPLVQRLEQRGIGRGIAILICYLLIVGALVILGLIYGVGLASEISAAAERLPRLYDATVAAWRQGTPIQQTVARGFPDFATLMRGGGLSTAGGLVGGIASGALGDLIYLVAVLSLAYYWLIEVTHFERLWLSLLPVATRVRARDIWRSADTAVGTYIRATLGAMVVAGLLLLALYTLVGLPFATLLALLGGLAQIVPRLGPAVGLLPAVAVGLAVSPLEGLAVLLGATLIQVLAHTLAQRMMRAAQVKVNPLLQVLLLLALADLGGVWAMIYAPPLAALLHVLYANLLSSSVEQHPEESALERLRRRLELLQRENSLSTPELSSTLQRSADLFQQAHGLLDEGGS